MSRSPTGTLAALTLGLCLVCPSRVHAGAALPTTDDAFSLLREEQTVIAPQKRPQALSEAPSSVTVIPAAEIQAMGYRTLGEALRWVRGIFVTYDRNYTYVGVRGLQRPGDYNNKVLLTLDGHTMNGNVFGEAYFGPELGLDLAQVERIEVVRGPGSTLYGSYAALAVVNVVTRRPRSEPGLAVSGGAGSLGTGWGRAAIASARAGWPEWHLDLSWLEARGADLYFREFDSPATLSGRATDVDGERALACLGAAEWRGVRLAFHLNDRRKTVPTASYGTVFGDPRTQTWDGHDFVEMSGARRAGAVLEVSARAYWDGARYHGAYVYAADSARVLNVDHGYGDVLGTEWRAVWAAGSRHTVTLGAEAQQDLQDRIWDRDVAPALLYYDLDPRARLFAAYGQDEVRVGSRLRLTGGLRVDDDSRYDQVASPRLDLVFAARSDTRLKLLAGSAFRAPSPYEDLVLGDPSQTRFARLQPERVATLEGTLEHEHGPLTASLTGYGNRVRDLIDLAEVDSTGETRYANRARVVSFGVESEVRLALGVASRARLAVAWQLSRDADTHAELSNSPRWNAHLLATHAPGAGRVRLGFGLRYLSPRLTLAGARTAAAVVADGRIARRLAHGLEVGLEGRNLFDARYGDPGSREHLQDQIAQDPRTIYATLSLGGSGSR